jgi:hypothetical protein
MQPVYAISLLIIITGSFYIWAKWDLKRRERKYNYPKAKISKEVDRLLSLDEYEMKSYHKN